MKTQIPSDVDGIHIEYYQPVFREFGARHQRKIKRAQIDIPRAVRRKFLFGQMQAGKTYDPAAAWDIFRNYLTAIEERMQRLLADHSVFYWLSVIRRTLPGLISPYDNKTDAHTSALVRRIEELAIRKFGRLDKTGDVCLSNTLRYGEILGGHYARVLGSRYGEQAPDIHARMLASPQWVLKDFSLREFIAIVRLEGLAYEYWHAMASMRTIGKGSSVRYQSGERWTEYTDEPKDMDFLISSYDERLAHQSADVTLLGTWRHDDSDFAAKNLVLAEYNVREVDLAPAIAQAFKVRLYPEFVPNFLLDATSIEDFWRAHEFMADAYRRATGMEMNAMLLVLWALSSHVFLPNRVLDAVADGSATWNEAHYHGVIHTHMRAYGTLQYDINSFADGIIARAERFGPDLGVGATDAASIKACIERLTHTPAIQRAMAIWSTGPYLPIVPYGDDAVVIDLCALIFVLRSLFYRVRDETGEKGTAFEEEFRRALVSRKFALEKIGKIYHNDGSDREIDASVRIGDDLYLFECYASERPLDFEIGKIATVETRNANLADKLDQANTLRDFVLEEKRGRNYDFSWAKEVHAFLVSPFVEWIWERSPALWALDGTPRILSASECLERFERARVRAARKQRRTTPPVKPLPGPPRYRRKKKR